jgi:hypothetical protein
MAPIAPVARTAPIALDGGTMRDPVLSLEAGPDGGLGRGSPNGPGASGAERTHRIGQPYAAGPIVATAPLVVPVLGVGPAAAPRGRKPQRGGISLGGVLVTAACIAGAVTGAVWLVSRSSSVKDDDLPTRGSEPPSAAPGGPSEPAVPAQAADPPPFIPPQAAPPTRPGPGPGVRPKPAPAPSTSPSSKPSAEPSAQPHPLMIPSALPFPNPFDPGP